MSSLGVNLENFLIPLEEINQATQNFSSKTLIRDDRYRKIYRGRLSKCWQNRNAAIKRHYQESDQGKEEFLKELELMFSFQHENIIPFIGYCNEGDEMIIVTEYAINGSLNDHLEDPIKRRCLTWARRLEICLGVATGLEYLHSGLGKRGSVIQTEPKSSRILLNENMEAKICEFGHSVVIPKDQPHVYAHAAGITAYSDPVSCESGIVMAKTGMYGFGMVLFEIISGMLAYHEKSFEDGKPQRLIYWVRRYSYDVGLEKLIDPGIRYRIHPISLYIVKKIAYKCISLNIEDRPTFDVIIKTIDKALDIHYSQYHGDASIVGVGSHRHKNLNLFIIPFEEIERATQNFSSETKIGQGRNSRIYRGQLSRPWQKRKVAIKFIDPENSKKSQKKEFLNELKLISSFHHENIIPFIGYCDEDDNMIIVTEYAINGSLKDHLEDPNKRRCLTWAQRLEICLGVATGLEYLHSGSRKRGRVIHRNPNSGNILLDGNMKAKICDFGLSVLIPKDQPHVCKASAGTQSYVDPVYEISDLKTESDVYTFGVVMFELLSGMLAYHWQPWNSKNLRRRKLINLVRCNYDDEPDKLVDPLIIDQVDRQSLLMFTDLAYECISFNLRERPSMNRIIKRIKRLLKESHIITTIQSDQKQQLEDFLIPLKEIKRAVGGNFSTRTWVGNGGFGVVHKGEIFERRKKRTVAIKRLKPQDDKGKKDFLNELKLIFKFQHENIIRFIGYCDEGNEMIIVTDYATNGSLDCYLEDEEKRRCLTWTQRLKICLGAARGLNHLHSGLGKGNKAIHRDIKSANILLDDKLEAKICDFGLSKLDLTMQESHLNTGVYTKQAGTKFYMDPTYQESGKLRTKSDVYSFGVVMFEMLSGMMAHHHKKFGDGKPQHLISLVRRYYEVGGIEMLMDPLIRDQGYDIDLRSFQTFQDTAYECINMNYKERPTVDTIVDRIEEALSYQASLPPPF